VAELLVGAKGGFARLQGFENIFQDWLRMFKEFDPGSGIMTPVDQLNGEEFVLLRFEATVSS
jgi:hypothetical protein